ncbi:RDD family protein [Kitasatospora sp. NPDC050543]|uniref:RDD family protein n=1 Tax=Kitasatospora sp. NPDC050543 TaxID=3364054 RepID=UPI0037B2CE84
MSYPPDPNNPYGQQPPPGYGYPQQAPPPGYGYPQQPAPAPGYGIPQQAPPPGYAYAQPGTIQANNGYINIANLGSVQIATMGQRFLARLVDGLAITAIIGLAMALGLASAVGIAKDTKTCTYTPGDMTGYQNCLHEQTQAASSMFAVLITMSLVIWAFQLLYEWLMVALAGATLGKLALGLRVVKEADGQVPGIGGGFVRFIIPIVGYFVCGIGLLLVYLSPFFDNSGKLQGWHDRAAGTVVIKK